MIPKAKALKLIAIHLYICQLHDNELKHLSQRYSNNDQPEFTDQEIMAIYIYAMQQEQRFRISQIHAFANDYLRSWFPALPSYQAFNNRLNRLSEPLKALTVHLITDLKPQDCSQNTSLLDSMPIITCSGKRAGKVALEITDKGYCSTKSLYYYGLKLHVLAFQRPKQVPFPEHIVLSTASENDLTVFKHNWGEITDRDFYGDKVYHHTDYFEELALNNRSSMFTPVKGVKGMPEISQMQNKAADDLYSTAVSKVRQPIESLFNWLIEKTDIQRASRVRSAKGLLVHVFGRMAAAFFYLIFNS